MSYTVKFRKLPSYTSPIVNYNFHVKYQPEIYTEVHSHKLTSVELSCSFRCDVCALNISSRNIAGLICLSKSGISRKLLSLHK